MPRNHRRGGAHDCSLASSCNDEPSRSSDFAESSCVFFIAGHVSKRASCNLPERPSIFAECSPCHVSCFVSGRNIRCCFFDESACNLRFCFFDESTRNLVQRRIHIQLCWRRNGNSARNVFFFGRSRFYRTCRRSGNLILSDLGFSLGMHQDYRSRCCCRSRRTGHRPLIANGSPAVAAAPSHGVAMGHANTSPLYQPLMSEGTNAMHV
jgi:hypothetical protein